MGTPSVDKVAKWFAAAGKTANVSPELRERIIIAGQFIENSVGVGDASSLLRGIDFSKPVKVCHRLPHGVYVQFVDHHLGSWFTYKGVLPDQVGLSSGFREGKDGRSEPARMRKLFRPLGAVAALESTAKNIKDWWTAGATQESIDPWSSQNRGQQTYGQMTSGGAKQYLVINKFQMLRVKS